MTTRSARLGAGVAASLLLSATTTIISTITSTPVVSAIDGEISIEGPPGSGCFGTEALALPNGNLVITDPCYTHDGVQNAGAVYLFDGGTRQMISRLHGTTANDRVGEGVVALGTGNVVAVSTDWDLGAIADVGAVTFIDGDSGLDGPVTAANSLHGTTASDTIGGRSTSDPPRGLVVPLDNGHYVVTSPYWDNGAIANAGAVTWADGNSGNSGPVTTANSLYGNTTFLSQGVSTLVGLAGVTPLSNGDYVVRSPAWSYVETPLRGTPTLVQFAGAATWATGSGSTAAPISRSNSIHGSTDDDSVGTLVTALTNGNYVAASPSWDNGTIVDTGAATWASGTGPTPGPVTADNSLVGPAPFDRIGQSVTALANGNYVVGSYRWHNAGAVAAGAATWGDGTAGTTGVVSEVNSLVGTNANDFLGMFITPLTNGNYVVASTQSDIGAPNAGSVTWANGATGITGSATAANSLYGTLDGDAGGTIVPLANGHAVLASPAWGSARGAVTWIDGITGLTGAISGLNSLVGPSQNDQFGADVTALADGNYVVTGSLGGTGGAVWVSGVGPRTGVLAAGSALVGGEEITSLDKGFYAVRSPRWDGPGLVDAGAVTIGRPGGVTTGTVSALNSVVGRTAGASAGSVEPSMDEVHGQVLVPIPTENRVVLVVIEPKLVPVVPARLLETRPGVEPGTVDGQFEGVGQVAGGGTIELQVAGRGGVPDDAVAAVLNVTVTGATDPGYVIAYPCGEPRPTASNVNYQAGQTIPNAVIARIGAGGKVCLYSLSTTHLIVDVNGYYQPGSGYTPGNPARIMETRPDQPLTVDGLYHGAGLLPAGTTTELQVSGRAGAPTDATVAVLNVTVTGPVGPGYVTVFPCGSPQPNASNLNHGAGETIPNLVVTQIGTGGKVCVYNLTATHLVVDLNGWHTPLSAERATNPARLLETRLGQEPTVDDQFSGIGQLAAGSTLVMPVAGRGGIPADANIASLNVTVTQPDGAGYITVYRCDRERPNASNLNYAAGQTIPNAVITGLADDGTICIYTLTATDLIVDANGSV